MLSGLAALRTGSMWDTSVSSWCLVYWQLPLVLLLPSLAHHLLTSMEFENQYPAPYCTETTSSLEQSSPPATQSDYISIPIWEAATLDEWLYNGGPYQLVVFHFLIGVFAYMGREWELSYRLGMRPWILCRIFSTGCSSNCGLSCLPVWARLVSLTVCRLGISRNF